MEKHFLADMMEGQPGFNAQPWYNPDGDCIVYKMADEAVVADRVDELLTVYNSAVDGRPIGFQIKGVNAMIRQLGLDGLLVESHADVGAVRKVSIAALLLAAYESRPPTLLRRKAYAAVMQCDASQSIPAEQLWSA